MSHRRCRACAVADGSHSHVGGTQRYMLPGVDNHWKCLMDIKKISLRTAPANVLLLGIRCSGLQSLTWQTQLKVRRGKGPRQGFHKRGGSPQEHVMPSLRLVLMLPPQSNDQPSLIKNE